MKVLFFGDIVGRPGREGLAKALPKLRKKFNPDVIGANVENLKHGRGISKETLNEMSEIGIDFFTSGNHIWEGGESKELLDKKDLPLVRPANYPPKAPGRGHLVVKVGTKKLLILNLMGRVFMKTQIDCPFRKADETLKSFGITKSKEGEILSESSDGEIDAVFVDFHAETTSEKRVLGFYLDGRVSAFSGTHTHIPTADEQILEKGMGYITDAGMCGALNSSLGVEKEGMIYEMLTQVPQKKEIAGGSVEIGAVLYDIDKNGKCVDIKRIREIVD